MKLLIAYDGSGNSRTAINDLQNAGLPAKTEAVIISVSEIYLPRFGEKDFAQADEDIAMYFQKHREQSERNIIETNKLAVEAKEKLQKRFPEWTIKTEVVSGSPTQRILSKSHEFEPDLIVLGAQGLSWSEETRLGNVAQIVLTEAKCAVRMTKAKSDKTTQKLKIAICFDNSPDSIKAVKAVASRNWKAEPEIGIFIVTGFIDPLIPGRVFRVLEGLPEKDLKGEREWAESLAGNAFDILRDAGFSASLKIFNGNPRMVLADKTKNWGADLAFVGARSGESEFSSLGSVALAVAARAACPVEIIR